MSNTRDRAENRDLIDTGIELASISCGGGVAVGLIILGTSAVIAALKERSSAMPIVIAGLIAVVVAILIVSLVYLIIRKNAKLKAAHAQIDELTRKERAVTTVALAAADAAPPASEHAETPDPESD
jgi:heme/copper-type cytochrome/quinol oxidase subunit 2